MIRRITVKPQAAGDAEEIFAFLVQQNAIVARRFNAADALIALRDDPGLGIAFHTRNGLLTKLRWKRIPGFKKYLIFFETEDRGIVVVRILHGSRDLDAIFGE